MNALPQLVDLPAVRLPAEPLGERLLTGAGMALDMTVVRAMRVVVNAALMPRPADAEALVASAAPYLDPALQADPHRFFAFMDEPPRVPEHTGRYRRTIHGGVVIRRRFRSEYEPFCRAAIGDMPPAPENDVIPVEHWVHEPARPAATVVALHGFSMGQPWMDGPALFASHWFRLGLDVALVTLPYHGARTPKYARFSGEMFASSHVGRLNEAMRQAVHDVRLVVAWLQRRSDAPVGLLGLSLGGYVAALMAGLSDELAFVVPMVPPVCMGDLAWRFFERSTINRQEATTPLSRDAFRIAFRVHSPLTYPLRVPAERVLIVAGRGDQVVPPEHPYALWRHWGEPGIYWFSGSHLAPFRRGRIATAIEHHLRSIGIV